MEQNNNNYQGTSSMPRMISENNSKKHLIFILIIVILLIITGGSYYYIQTRNVEPAVPPTLPSTSQRSQSEQEATALQSDLSSMKFDGVDGDLNQIKGELSK